MAGKTDPAFHIDSFQKSLEDVLDVHQVTCAALADHRLTYRRAASRDAFFRAAVLFDAFRSDWFIACVNRKPAKFRQDYETRVRQSMAGRGFAGLLSYVDVDIPQHPSLRVIGSVLDPDERHISFGARWKSKAEALLDQEYVDLITGVGSSDLKLIQAATAIRDCIAHGSRSSTDGMNTALDALDPVTDESLRRDTGTARVRASGVPTYLHANTPTHRTRTDLYIARLRGIAEQLRP